MQNSIKKISIAGSGNIAWHLAKGLTMQGYRIGGIWSRNFSNAVSLAQICDATACINLAELRDNSELIIIAVSDKAIDEVARNIGNYDGIVVHTAGSVPVDVLKENFENCGVFYPLQTFSKESPVDLSEVPFFIESSSADVFQALKKVAQSLSGKIYEADSRQRMLLHVAAVFAGNYSNLMYVIGNEILKNSNLPFDALHALITETARKATATDPVIAQTGPARRNDTITIAKHIEILASMPEYAELYRRLANLISHKYTL